MSPRPNKLEHTAASPVLRKDEREDNANVLDIYSSGVSPLGAEPHTYRKWKPIDTGKFGFDVSVPPSSRTPVQTLGVGVKTQ